MGGIGLAVIVAGVSFILAIIAIVLSRRKGKSSIDNSVLELLKRDQVDGIEQMRQAMQGQIDAMRTEYGDRFADIPSETLVDELESRMEGLNEYVIDEHQNSRRENLEKLDEIKQEMEQDMKERIVAQAKRVISESSVSREEFEDIERRLDSFVGDDTQEEKLALLSGLFDSQKQAVINWKCKIINLLHDGVAPEIDERKFALNGVPFAEGKKFLKKLLENDIAEKREIDAYTINEDYLWMDQYVDKPSWLREAFEKSDLKAKKEKEYQKWMQDNLDKIEEGLLKENREAQMEEGTIDFLCRDKTGKLVGLELKFPKATKRDAKQLIGYAEGIATREHEENFRGIMVAPEIPVPLRELLEQHGLDWREVQMDEAEVESQDVDEAEVESQDVDEEEWNAGLDDMDELNSRREI
tara:strand:+ start:399 stop:1634 length:1236 start_codon:yes stop_codon:yes gene_type:complete